MRRFKAMYLAIILAVLWVGAGVAGWMLLISPAKELYKNAEGEWSSAKTSMESAYNDAMAAQTQYPIYAQSLLENNERFTAIQKTMPDIYNLKSQYAASPREGLRYLYQAMGTGKVISELKSWTAKYQLANPPKYQFTGILGYQDTLTGVKVVLVPFGEQTFRGRGFRDLISKVRNRYGYRHCPLLITGPDGNILAAGGAAPAAAPEGGAPPAEAPPGGAPPTGAQGAASMLVPPGSGPTKMTMNRMQAVPSEAPAGAPAPGDPGTPEAAPAAGAPAAASAGGGIGTFHIDVDQYSANHSPAVPALEMKYKAYGVFITKGWDPLAEKLQGGSVEEYLIQAKNYIDAPPSVAPKTPPEPYPLIFWFLGARDDVQ